MSEVLGVALLHQVKLLIPLRMTVAHLKRSRKEAMVKAVVVEKAVVDRAGHGRGGQRGACGQSGSRGRGGSCGRGGSHGQGGSHILLQLVMANV